MNNNIIIKVVLFLSILLIGTSCEELVVEKFESSPSLYFQGYLSPTKIYQRDSIGYSFFLTPSDINEVAMPLNVRLTGNPVNHDRVITINQSNTTDEDAAVAGMYYKAFDSSDASQKLVMPAGQVSTDINIILLRHKALETKEYRLVVKLDANKEFTNGAIEHSEFLIKISAMISQPASWTTLWRNAFGTFGQVKMKFIIDYLGWTDFETSVTADMLLYLKMQAQQKLAEYEAINGPLYENDGVTKVTF